MSLDHVYIVLEPVGSARLTFDDDRYYEFMCFDVRKVVWSPRCDHGHNEESQNGQDMNIDILEGYVWTPEWFQMSSGIYRTTGGVTGTPRGLNGPTWALVEERGEGQEERRPQAQSELGRGPAPLSFSPSLSSFF